MIATIVPAGVRGPGNTITEPQPTAASLGSRFVILRRINGHFEPISPAIESLPNEGVAIARVNDLARRYPNQTFAWFELRGQAQPVAKQTEIVRAAQ